MASKGKNPQSDIISNPSQQNQPNRNQNANQNTNQNQNFNQTQKKTPGGK